MISGLARTSDILQIAAYDGKDLFNTYITPTVNISPKASEITGLKFNFGTNEMTHHGEPVESKPAESVLLDFIDFIRDKKQPLLIGHNIASFDVPILLRQLQRHSLLSEFMLLISGCVDTMKLAKQKYEKKEVGNYKQQNLVSKLLGKEYNAHDASADVLSLHELLQHLNFTEKDVFPFHSEILIRSFSPLLNGKKLTKATVRKLAHCGLSMRHLELAANRNADNGVKSILIEHGFSSRIANALTQVFDRTEE